jgi:NTE family protein
MSEKGSIKIGFALGGGAARGLSHIGVLKVLDEHGIFPDIIAGTSIGAIVGALYAGGYKPSEIEQIVLGLDWKKLVRLVDMTLPLRGLLKGKRVITLLRSVLGDLTFPQLRCDFACVATDIINGEQVVLRSGSLIDAVRASISIPGIFAPVAIKGRYLVDGSLVNAVPVSVCREMGAGYVIGVNVVPDPSKVICNSNKGQQYQVCGSTLLEETGDKTELSTVSRIDSHSLRSRIADIENATKLFLMSHRPKRGRGILESSLSSEVNKVLQVRAKSPGLIDVLSQSWTIAEYRVAVENLKNADLVISPDVEEIGFWQFNNAAQAIAAGEHAARMVLDGNKVPSLLGQF